MARIRSPGYPSFSLEQAVEFARKIHEADRQHPVPRDVAARHMGFSGISGSSDRALSALMHFNLAEKVGKGEIRITGLALRIVHPESDRERKAALQEAAFSPSLFAELRERYDNAPPSIGSLQSYLSRENFAPAAIGPAAKAYLETCWFLQREGAYESDGGRVTEEPESGSPTPETPMSDTAPTTVPRTAPQAHGFLAAAASVAAYANTAAGVRREVFSIGDDGELVLTLPSRLSEEAFADLEDTLEMIARKAARKVSKQASMAEEEDGPNDGDLF